MKSSNKFETFIQKFAAKIQENQYIQAISSGLMSLMPLMIVGAMASLISGLPYPPYQEFLNNVGLTHLLQIVTKLTTDIIAVYASFSIAYKFAVEQKQDGFSAGILGMLSFLILSPLGSLEEGGAYISFQWLGGSGLFVAMIAGLLASKLYTIILQKGIYIKMPDGVPPTLEKSFAAIVPGFIITPLMVAITAIFEHTQFASIHGFIFGLIQTPLTKLGGSPITFIFMILFCHILWAFGIHGMSIFFAVMFPVLTPLGLQNLEAYRAGLALPNVLTFDSIGFALIGGSGATLGLVIAMLVKSKSKQFKTIGKLGILPSLCGINEPIMFGVPVVLNPHFVIPLIATPTITFLLGYLLTLVGILPRLSGISAPLGTPIIIQGFIIGGWRIALYQVFATALSYFMYLPFFKKADSEAVANETKASSNEMIETIGA
ncbi:PTS cellbiose transporter subunit IIC [Enterococcus sp. JM4C]|uniref:PTS sugar transporter subunit IIC n=1 Tax=Candidatus Enterococcus huntleyi TaxID=1857217 RepID=UPI00137ADF30|nr:PTS transporter subunit EIIC [Enterococcus sp. JM4C]KAF1297546.1 PTS cellbiose transporter subunit IIC [Enterococcus sp. JM4C]